MRMEGGPKLNVVSLENTVVGAARRYSEAQFAEVKKEIKEKIKELQASLPWQKRQTFEQSARMFEERLADNFKKIQEDFLRNISNAANIKDEITRTSRRLFLHNNLNSQLIFLRTNLFSNFILEWQDGEDEHQERLAA